jgi:serine/threonine protein kinase
MDFHVGQKLGDYTVTGIAGAGGIGRVYRVEHCLTKRTEAMKVLSAEFATDIQISRFEREMRVLARLDHPNIAGLHNALHSEKKLILLMEFIEGRTLESMFLAGRLPLPSGIEYVRQTLLALGYAHQQGVVHRDVTPANVMVTYAGQVKLTDFGLSKSFGEPLLTGCGEVLGSLPYLAPEQVKGATKADRRSDLYAVGAILYEHLTGQKPFGTNRRIAAVLTDSEAEAKPPSEVDPSLSRQWDQIIRRAIARDPALRFQSADEFLEALDGLEGMRTAKPLVRYPRKLGIAIAISVGLVLALFASPAIYRFQPVPDVAPPLKVWHAAPPDFAFTLAQHDDIKQAANPPAIRHSKRSDQVAESTEPEMTAPGITAAGPAPPAEASENKRGLADSGSRRDVDEQLNSEKAKPEASEAPSPKKKKFWSKLNIFRKHKSEVSQGNQQP